ncbi:hypothetical protein PoB_003893400 [Plakobranchus ocellatus]|uniref:Uncharacterized protein n=1 Tax=Plakobranchus ocellatus TaxID=259542 RepID=A0AAV4B167_9GAST|nr:hypothetical protein PoB_003893400 [Plakobranchus ocellatus]
MFEDLQRRFHGCVPQRECSKFYLDDFTNAERVELQDLFGQAIAHAETKLEKYFTPKGQPGIQFLKDIQFFNPKRIIFFSGAEDVIAIKELGTVTENGIKKYWT